MKKFFKKLFFKIYAESRISFYKLLSNNKIEGPIRFIQATQVVGLGKIISHKNVKIGYFPSPYFFSTYAYLEARKPNSLIEIGENTHINNGFVAIAENSSIKIGKNCFIGTRVEILDSDFHSLSWKDRTDGVEHLSNPIQIGDNVFIGSNVKILKGVSVGDGAVIANSAVVTRDIPPNTLAAGIPATVIREINNG